MSAKSNSPSPAQGQVQAGRQKANSHQLKGNIMAKVISVINLKRGVAKTTTTIQLAECLASEFSKKVLVIDLDPQTNSTIALIDEDK